MALAEGLGHIDVMEGDLKIAKIVLHSLWTAPVMSLNWGNLVQTNKFYFQEVNGQLDNFTPAVLN